MSRLIIASLLVICVAALAISLGTFAYFSDSASSTGNTFSSGTLSLADPLALSSWSASITNLAPGDIRTATVSIVNDGSLPLQYKARVVSSGALFGGATPATATINCGAAPTDLAVGITDSCTVTVSFPAIANNDYQGVSGTVTVQAEAHQVGSTEIWSW